MSSWSKDNTIEFIEIYRDNECLWRVKSKDYTNKLKRDRSYEVLVNYIKRFEPGANKDSVVKKINNLRSSFRKEVKKVEASQQPGAAVDDIHEPRLWYYDLLYFLRDQETPRHSRSNIELVTSQPQQDSREYEVSASPLTELEGETDIDLDLDVVEEEQETEVQPSQSFTYNDNVTSNNTSNNTASFTSYNIKRPRLISPTPSSEVRKLDTRKTAESPSHATTERLKNSHVASNNSTSTSSREDHQCLLFGKYIAQRLRNLPRMQRIHAEKLFSEVLYEAELGTLNRNSAVVTQAQAGYCSNGFFTLASDSSDHGKPQ